MVEPIHIQVGGYMDLSLGYFKIHIRFMRFRYYHCMYVCMNIHIYRYIYTHRYIVDSRWYHRSDVCIYIYVYVDASEVMPSDAWRCCITFRVPPRWQPKRCTVVFSAIQVPEYNCYSLGFLCKAVEFLVYPRNPIEPTPRLLLSKTTPRHKELEAQKRAQVWCLRTNHNP